MIAAALVLVATPSGQASDPVLFAPLADARVQEAKASTNYGASTVLATDESPRVETYLRFDLRGLAGTVESARLRLFATNGTSNGPAVYGTSSDWGERTLTWKNRPAAVGPASDDRGAIAHGAWVEYDVTALVAGDGLVSFLLAQPGTDGADFNSREASSNRPELVVTTASGPPPPPDTAPQIGRSPASLNFQADDGGSAPAPQSVSITNAGAETLEWSAFADEAWLSVSPASGTTTSETDTLTVSVDQTGLSAGVHTGTITIADPDASNTSETVAVTLNVVGDLPAFIAGEAQTDGASAVPESSSYYGPFIDGNGDLYVFLEDNENGFHPHAYKSTDGGHTWTPGAMLNTVTDLETMSCVRDPANETIHCLADRSTGSVKYFAYRTSDHATNPDSWTAPESLTSGHTPRDNAVALVRRSDGDLIAFYRTTPAGDFQRIGYRIKPNGGTWSAQALLDTTPSTNFTQVTATLGEADVTHIFYNDETNQDIRHRTLTEADVLSTAQTVNDEAVKAFTAGESNPMVNGGAVYVDDSGTERIFLAFQRASDDALVSVELVDGVKQTNQAVAATPVYANPANQGSFQPVAAIAADATRVFVVYADASTHDLWYVMRHAGAWGSPTELLDARDVKALTATAFTHSVANGGADVLGIVETEETGFDSGDMNWYTEAELTPPPDGPG